MKNRYRLFLRRGSVYYAFDHTTKTFESLKTKDKAFDLIRTRLLIETQAEHFLEVLKKGTVSTNVYLRKTHNFALDMNWLAATVIPPAAIGCGVAAWAFGHRHGELRGKTQKQTAG